METLDKAGIGDDIRMPNYFLGSRTNGNKPSTNGIVIDFEPNYFLGSRTNGNFNLLISSGVRVYSAFPNYFLGSRTNGNLRSSKSALIRNEPRERPNYFLGSRTNGNFDFRRKAR